MRKFPEEWKKRKLDNNQKETAEILESHNEKKGLEIVTLTGHIKGNRSTGK